MRKFKVSKVAAGKRADVFITSKYKNFTRSSLEALFETQKVSSNGKPIKASYKVKAGDELAVDGALLRQRLPITDLPIIYEDNDVIVINKPAGVLTHSKGALNLEATVASFIKPKLNDAGLKGNRAGIVHRLDRATSGVIITAKNRAALVHLQKQFSKRRVKKIYEAIVEGVLEPKEAVIDVPILRNPARPQTFMASRLGRPAQTAYKSLKQFTRQSKTYTLVELAPKTGRTHQLRVHLKYVGHPIVGDPIYGHGDGDLMLHAKSLEVTLPSSDRKVFEVPIPERIKEFSDV